MNASIAAIGGYVPPTKIDNHQIAAWTGTTPEWVFERTGILERRYADTNTATSDLAYYAVLDMLHRSPNALDGVNIIIVCTSTPDESQPPTAARVQRRLRLSGVPAFDVNAVCSGWLFGLKVAAGFIASRPTDRVLLVAADKYSTIVDRRDKRTVSLFGDGAAAVVVSAVMQGYGLRSLRLVTHGEHSDLVQVKAGGSRLPFSSTVRDEDLRFQMDGRAVKRYAVDHLDALVRAACTDARLSLDQIDRFVFHQANVRLLETIADHLGVPADRLPLTATRYGNTGSASLPLTLLHAHDTEPLRTGDALVFGAIGGGMSGAAGALRWRM